MAEVVFGSTIVLSTGRILPVRWIGEQHVREDLGFIPSFADWVKAIRPERWMGHTSTELPDGFSQIPVSPAGCSPNRANGGEFQGPGTSDSLCDSDGGATCK